VCVYVCHQRGIPHFVDTLNFKKLKVGMQMLGAVREINELDIVVALPNGMSGYVSLAEGTTCRWDCPVASGVVMCSLCLCLSFVR
jgi:hypothetical protein